MSRIIVMLALAALVALPLQACGKKGDPEAQPERVIRTMPPPNPPPTQKPPQ